MVNQLVVEMESVMLSRDAMNAWVETVTQVMQENAGCGWFAHCMPNVRGRVDEKGALHLECPLPAPMIRPKLTVQPGGWMWKQ